MTMPTLINPTFAELASSFDAEHYAHIHSLFIRSPFDIEPAKWMRYTVRGHVAVMAWITIGRYRYLSFGRVGRGDVDTWMLAICAVLRTVRHAVYGAVAKHAMEAPTDESRWFVLADAVRDTGDDVLADTIIRLIGC